MWLDIFVIVYVLALFPLIHECEKLEKSGLKVLIHGILFTPIMGYVMLAREKRKMQKKERIYFT